MLIKDFPEKTEMLSKSTSSLPEPPSSEFESPGDLRLLIELAVLLLGEAKFIAWKLGSTIGMLQAGLKVRMS